MLRLKQVLYKLLIILGILLLSGYTIFRAYYINFSPQVVLFSIILFLAEFHTLLLTAGMFYSLWPRKHPQYKKINRNKDLQVNLFITIAGEPIEIVRDTILHAKKAAQYYKNTVKPHKDPRVIVLNDGKAAKKEGWEDVASYCKKLDVYHIARDTNEGFKAGNINNGIQSFPARNSQKTIDCFFDADFCAKENFVTEILKPFLDTDIDFVQTPQRYRNLNTWVAEAAGSHQIFFFDYICPAKSADNALFLCGTNYAIRRQALLDAGGVDSRFVTEDYATSIRLHLLGKRGVFLPKVLALGLAPMNLKEYFNQQTRWCKGCLDANSKFFKELFFGHLTIRQKFHYFLSTAYYLIGVRDLILILAPIPFLFFGISLIRANTLTYLTLIYFPYMVYCFTLFLLTFRNPVKSLVLNIVSFPVFASAFISCIVKRNIPFTITIKKYEKENPFKVYTIQLLVACMLVAGLIYSSVTKSHVNVTGTYINYFWALYDAILLFIGFWLVIIENLSFTIVFPSLKSSFKGNVNKSLWAGTLIGLFIFVYMIMQHNNIQLTTAAQAQTNVLNIKKQELLIPHNSLYYGYYLTSLNAHPHIPKSGILPNEKASLAMYFQDWGEEKQFDTKFMNSLSDQNVIPVITWEPWNVKATQNGKIIQKDYSPKAIANGKYDTFIRNWAHEASVYNKPYFLRFAHEMNGNWYPWGNMDGNTPQDYKKMWIHVHTIFVEEGATNTIWVWAPNNTDENGQSQSVMDFYPGDTYVDWVGYSGFNWGNTKKTSWMSFQNLSQNIYAILGKLHKPIMVAETSTVGNTQEKENWFSETIADIHHMPKIKAMMFYDEDFKTSNFMIEKEVAEKSLYPLISKDSYFLKNPLIITVQKDDNKLLSAVFNIK
ncbi:MAG TPA: glycosyltransferase family 2 protein [Candidatus Saccharimonadales bacterium]|nr:glycosyltransferase family 2 protein [Candidatus Saccharimonadales bacterium]